MCTAIGQSSTGPEPREGGDPLTAVSQSVWTALDWVSSLDTRWTLTSGNGFVITYRTLGGDVGGQGVARHQGGDAAGGPLELGDAQQADCRQADRVPRLCSYT